MSPFAAALVLVLVPASYSGDERGTVQVLTYTGRNLFDEYRSVMEEFLNGLILK